MEGGGVEQGPLGKLAARSFKKSTHRWLVLCCLFRAVVIQDLIFYLKLFFYIF
jgi:hypothetical protein